MEINDIYNKYQLLFQNMTKLCSLEVKMIFLIIYIVENIALIIDKTYRTMAREKNI